MSRLSANCARWSSALVVIFDWSHAKAIPARPTTPPEIAATIAGQSTPLVTTCTTGEARSVTAPYLAIPCRQLDTHAREATGETGSMQPMASSPGTLAVRLRIWRGDVGAR